MFARFDENPAMTLQDIKETKRYGRTDNVKTVYPPQTKFAGGIITHCLRKSVTLSMENRFSSKDAHMGPFLSRALYTVNSESILSCQPRVTVTSCFVDKVIRDL